MPFLEEMTDNLNNRINNAGTPYPQFIYFADVHYEAGKTNPGFEKILTQIENLEKDKTLFILIGGDLINSGSTNNYTAFIDRCRLFYEKTGIPIIPTMGNHEYYGVQAKDEEVKRYKQYIGDINFPLEISKKGLPDSLTVVAFHDSKPRKPYKISLPDRANGCTTITKDYHLFYFPLNYIKLDKLAPNKYSHFPDNLKNSKGNHIIVTTHVPPRKDPLPIVLDNLIEKEYKNCVSTNPIITMSNLKKYYRDLWMLVHGNSTTDKNDSTQWFVDEIKNRKKVELVLSGHVHTYFPFTLPEANHNLQVVISGGGGNNSAKAYDIAYPVTKYHYIKVIYDSASKRFTYEKVDAGN